MNDSPDDVSPLEFFEVRIPPRSECDARAALLGPDGGESHLIAQDRKFALLNHVETALQAASSAAATATRLERELHTVERKLVWTAATIMKPSPGADLNRFHLALALLLSAAAAIGMIVSNVVLSEYVLRSASDLFANNRSGAILFATLPCLGAVALKVFEQRLVSPNARWFYGAAVFSVGMASLVVWLGAAAIVFAPDMAGSLAQLTQGPSDRLVGIVLLLTTVVCDVTLGATLLSGVAHQLSEKKNSEAIPNPDYAALFEEKLRLEGLIAQARRNRAEADDYLSRAAAGREVTRREAEHDLNRARELWTQAQTAALAFAIAIFLSRGEDTP
jgi:hypothetical protein